MAFFPGEHTAEAGKTAADGGSSPEARRRCDRLMEVDRALGDSDEGRSASRVGWSASTEELRRGRSMCDHGDGGAAHAEGWIRAGIYKIDRGEILREVRRS